MGQLCLRARSQSNSDFKATTVQVKPSKVKSPAIMSPTPLTSPITSKQIVIVSRQRLASPARKEESRSIAGLDAGRSDLYMEDYDGDDRIYYNSRTSKHLNIETSTLAKETSIMSKVSQHDESLPIDFFERRFYNLTLQLLKCQKQTPLDTQRQKKLKFEIDKVEIDHQRANILQARAEQVSAVSV